MNAHGPLFENGLNTPCSTIYEAPASVSVIHTCANTLCIKALAQLKKKDSKQETAKKDYVTITYIGAIKHVMFILHCTLIRTLIRTLLRTHIRTLIRT